MTETKVYCDHCGKEISHEKDHIEMSVDAGKVWFETDLCDKCCEELGNLVEKFCNIGGKDIEE